ncbi:MAG: MFS transporter [Chloroflexota bacterium]
MKNRTLVFAILSASLAVMLSTGIRQSFGLLLQPIGQTLGTGRTVFSLAIALSNIIYGLPLVGILADRIGSRRVLLAGGGLYALGLVLLSRISSAGGLYLTLGGMVGVALSATTYVVVLGAVGQMVSPDSRSRVFGIITAAGSSGMFVVPPLVQFLLTTFNWQRTLLVLAAISLVILLLAFGLPNRPGGDLGVSAEGEEPFAKILRRASGHGGYLLLIVGFFVCGFHVAFISTHLPAYLGDNGLPPFTAAAALSLIGGFNMAGSVTFGWLGDRFRKKNLLSLVYLLRSIIITLFLLLPLTQLSALVFAGAIGFVWLATVPLTSGTVAQIFGTRYLSTLYGIVFLSHQVGAFLGVWLGGRLYDTVGSYDAVWYMAIALGVVASLAQMAITDRPAVPVAATANP